MSWSHHWVWCALIGIVCVDLARRSSSALVRAGSVAVVVPFALGLVFWPPHTAHLELHDSALQLLLSASYVLAGLLVCMLIAYDLRKGQSSWNA